MVSSIAETELCDFRQKSLAADTDSSLNFGLRFITDTDTLATKQKMDSAMLSAPTVSHQARKRHTNITFLVRLHLGRLQVCTRHKHRFSPHSTNLLQNLHVLVQGMLLPCTHTLKYCRKIYSWPGKAELDTVSWYMPKSQALELGIRYSYRMSAEFLALELKYTSLSSGCLIKFTGISSTCEMPGLFSENLNYTLTQNYYLRQKYSEQKTFGKITNLTRNSLKMSLFPGHFENTKSLKNYEK